MANAEQIKDRIIDMVIEGELHKDDWVEIIQLIAGGIGALPLTAMAKKHNMSYPGALKSPKFKKFRICNVLFAMEA